MIRTRRAALAEHVCAAIMPEIKETERDDDSKNVIAL